MSYMYPRLKTEVQYHACCTEIAANGCVLQRIGRLIEENFRELDCISSLQLRPILQNSSEGDPLLLCQPIPQYVDRRITAALSLFPPYLSHVVGEREWKPDECMPNWMCEISKCECLSGQVQQLPLEENSGLKGSGLEVRIKPLG